MQSHGTLIVVGTGIQGGAQTPLAAKVAIERADRVLFAVTDADTVQWIRALSPAAESLRYPRDGVPRRQIYRQMVDQILAEVRKGGKVCAAFYGHPGVLAEAPHEAVRLAREEGHTARMLPGISFLDCLFCDLAIDPGQQGCQVYVAGRYLRRRPAIDVCSTLILCQIGMIGNRGVFDPAARERIRAGLSELGAALRERYPEGHEVIVYEASTDPWGAAKTERMPLAELADAPISEVSTLVIPGLPD